MSSKEFCWKQKDVETLRQSSHKLD